MPYETSFIATIVAGLGLAFLLGYVAHRFRVSPLVGYVLAGVVVGPHTPGFVADQALAGQLAEIGVILLMFGVGLHFSPKDLLAVRGVALPGALIQIVITSSLGAGVALGMGWSLGTGFVFGLALAIASTVVVMRTLQERRLIRTEKGRVAVGWLVVEDVTVVLVLVLLPAIAEFAAKDNTPAGSVSAGHSAAGQVLLALVITFAKVVGFIAIMLLVGRRLVPWFLHYVARSASRELFRLAVLGVALGIAFGAAALFDVSFALGAFFAGMVLSESKLSQRATEETLPLRDAFAVLFFVSVGMLLNPEILVRDPGPLAAVVVIIVLWKPFLAFLIVRALGRPPSIALAMSGNLGHIGEFSFIFVTLAVSLGLLPEHGRDYVLAGAILSILLNPALILVLERLQPAIERLPVVGARRRTETSDGTGLTPTTLTGHAVLIGYGRVGRVISDALRQRGERFLVIEERAEVADALRAGGTEVINGNAVDAKLLEAANIAGARFLFVAIPNAFEAGQIVAQAGTLNKSLQIHARAHSDEEIEHLRAQGAHVVIMGETEIALGMLGAAFPKDGTISSETPIGS